MNEHTLTALAGIGVTAIVCQWLSWRTHLPAILYLLIAGIVAGPVTGWLDPDAVFGDLLFPFVSFAVAVILFEGSLTLKFREIQGLERVIRNMVSIGIAITWVIIALATHFLMGFSWALSWLFGAIMVVTGPTVIEPMLRTVRPTARVAKTLKWEGILIDPLGALLAVLVFEFIISGSTGNGAFGHTLLTFAEVLAVGIFLGSAAGYSLGVILRRHLLPEYLHNTTTLLLVFAVFTVSDVIQAESGLLTVTVMGIWMANMRGLHLDDIRGFKEDLSLLLISGLFIILAARIDLAEVAALSWVAILLLMVFQFIARPIKILVSTKGSTLSWQERAMLSWIAPRGIVAAAVASLFSIKLEQQGFADADLLVPLTFMIIAGTVVVQGLSARGIGKALGIAQPPPNGVLIVGSNPVAREIAVALKELGLSVLMADRNAQGIHQARLQGIKTYYGNPVSTHASLYMDTTGLGTMLAITPQSDLADLAMLHFRGEFGKNNVYRLPESAYAGATQEKKETLPYQEESNILFSDQASYQRLINMINQGARIHDTHLTKDYTFLDFQKQHGKNALPLFAMDPKKKIITFSAGEQRRPGAGWTLISLIKENEPGDSTVKQAHRDKKKE